MADPETPLRMAQRHVASQEALIEKQLALIQGLQRGHQPTDLAMSMLATMERTLEIYRRDLDRLSRQT